MPGSLECGSHRSAGAEPLRNRGVKGDDDRIRRSAGAEQSPLTFGWEEGTQILDLDRFAPPEESDSGTFDLRGSFWTTTFGKLLQALPLMTFLIDRSLGIVAANRACEKLSPHYERVIGAPFVSLFSEPSDAITVEEAVTVVFSSRKQHVAQASLGIGRNRIWGRMTFRPIRMGAERLVMATIEDLTIERQQLILEQRHNEALEIEINRRRSAEKNLVASERRYRQVVETAHDLIYTTDAHGRFTYLNPLALRRLGYSEEELTGKHFLIVVHPDNRTEVRKRYVSQFSERTPQTYYELPILSNDGESIWIGQNVQLLTEDGIIIGFQAIARDITERKIAEERLKASLAEKEVLMREIHHRVKNNLQVISALLTLQADRVGEQKSAEVLASTNARIWSMALVHEKLYQSANVAQVRIDEYVADLVNDLLGFGRTDATGIAVKIDMEKLSFDPDTAIPIAMIVAELLTNAMKHAFPAGRQGVVHVRLRSVETDTLELMVSDNGIGMATGVVPGNTQSLGLELVAAFAGRLRGEIHFDTSQGTEISIRFKRPGIRDRS